MQSLITAITLVGGQQRLAAKVGLRQSAIANWIKRGSIPAEHCARIEAATAGRVTRKDLRPADWHDIWPELAEPATFEQDFPLALAKTSVSAIENVAREAM